MEDLFIVLLKSAFMWGHGYRFGGSFQAVFEWVGVDGRVWGWNALRNRECKFIFISPRLCLCTAWIGIALAKSGKVGAAQFYHHLL
jgi:hypothetical protein